MRSLAAALALLWSLPWAGAADAQDRLLVFAASSMSEIVAELAVAFEAKSGTGVTLSLAGTQHLARQIAQGAPADVLISANRAWADWLVERQSVEAQSIRAFAGNELVIAGRREMENWADPEGLLTRGRFAMGDPQGVPAGVYAREALEKRGLWETAKGNAVFGENVRVALKRVVLGEVESAIVYKTDVALESDLRTVFTFAASDHAPIEYLAMATIRSRPGTDAFLAFLQSDEAVAILTRHGFTPPPSP